MKTLDLGKVALVPRGDYDAGVAYSPLDIITHEGSSYLVLKDCTGQIPSNDKVYYQLLSERGPQGEKGDTGPQGPTGPQGATGAKGATGSSGSNATINGYNTLTLKGASGISVTNSGSTCIISQSSGSGSLSVVCGSYTGTGTKPDDNRNNRHGHTDKTITVSGLSTIKLAIVWNKSYYTNSDEFDSFSFAMPGYPRKAAQYNILSVSGNTITASYVYQPSSTSTIYIHEVLPNLNKSGETYYYCAIGT